MKILVFSDTHASISKMYEIISKNRLSCDLVIHLGDHYTDIDKIRNDFPQVAFLGVRGNCDYIFSDKYPHSHTITLEGKTLYMTHGHMQAIKTHSLSLLAAEAKRACADIVLYGHTHVALIKEENGITYFNPGSLERPRDASYGSYGEININNGKATFKIHEIEI